MRLVTYLGAAGPSFGVSIGEGRILDLPAALSLLGVPAPRTMEELLGLGDVGLEYARDAAHRLGGEQAASVSIDAVRLLAPVRRPGKIVAVGLNYMDHCREQKVQPPKSPILFSKFPNSITDPGGVISWDARLTRKVDFEAELGVVIGRRARGVSAERALEYVAGYTALNDISARDLQFSDGQWVRGKSLDGFCPVGPVLVTRDEIPDPQHLRIRCRVNGTVYQDSNTSEMIFPVPRLIEFIAEGITLEPGDVIATGTPHGVGVFRTPPVYLADGDEVCVDIERIGELRNRCSTH